ncbi:hypothetical protein TrispH2_009287 [Trichoplax sp. H2]|nr:hypothetical protein TrispH2_009287 [Trichoplax sp. H2]|eukprot:RDD38135.1 hypothetical protein TrispH2_009287 [Trichoplax sp. H2]
MVKITQANLHYHCNITDPKHHFFEIAFHISYDWTKLAAALDPFIDVSSIKTEESKIFDQARLFLDKWYCKNTPNVSVDQLQVALQKIGRNDIISSLGHLLKNDERTYLKRCTCNNFLWYDENVVYYLLILL